jgi:hypothetical protein
MRNYFVAKFLILTKIAITKSCTTGNGGSLCAGADAWIAGISRNDGSAAKNQSR